MDLDIWGGTSNYVLVLNFFNRDTQKTILWFETPNPLLSNICPAKLSKEKLSKFVRELLEREKNV